MTKSSGAKIEATATTNIYNHSTSTILTCIYLTNMTKDSLLDTLTFADIPSHTVLTSNLQDGLIKKSAFATSAFIYHFDDIRDAIDMVLRRIRDKENKHIASIENSHINPSEPPPLFFKLDYSVRDHCLKMNELFEREDVKFVCSRACQDVLNCKSSISSSTSIKSDYHVIQHSTFQSLPSSTILITVQFSTSIFSDEELVSFDSVDDVVLEVKSHLSKFGSILSCSELKRSLLTGSTFKFFIEYYRVSDCQAFLSSNQSCFLGGEDEDVKINFENVNLYDIDRDALFFSREVSNNCRTPQYAAETSEHSTPLSNNTCITYSSIASSMLTPPQSIDTSASAHQNHVRRISNTSSTVSSSNNSDDGLSGPSHMAAFEYNFEIDLEKIENGSDRRTTCMIRNIPNKYTQQMILDLVNESHRGCFDFLYLRMDFRNRCNVGYAFINFVSSSHIESFSNRVNGRRWARFNSDKVCHLTFARIQGITALVDKFKNSKVMFEAPAFRPKLFHISGPLTGQEAPFPQC